MTECHLHHVRSKTLTCPIAARSGFKLSHLPERVFARFPCGLIALTALPILPALLSLKESLDVAHNGECGPHLPERTLGFIVCVGLMEVSSLYCPDAPRAAQGSLFTSPLITEDILPSVSCPRLLS